MYILAGCYKDFAFKFLMVVGAVFSLWKSKQVSITFSFSDGNIKYLCSVNCIQLSSLQTQFLLPRVWPVESSIAAHCVCTLCAKSLQSCLTLCYPVDCSPPGSSVSGILQARILEWVAMPSSRETSRPRDRTRISYVSCTVGEFFTTESSGRLLPISNYYWVGQKFVQVFL